MLKEQSFRWSYTREHGSRDASGYSVRDPEPGASVVADPRAADSAQRKDRKTYVAQFGEQSGFEHLHVALRDELEAPGRHRNQVLCVCLSAIVLESLKPTKVIYMAAAGWSVHRRQI
jgi:hypothetical protein